MPRGRGRRRRLRELLQARRRGRVPEVDGYWFQPNADPAEMPALEPAVAACLTQMRQLADELLVLCAGRWGWKVTGHATHTMNIHWYPRRARPRRER